MSSKKIIRIPVQKISQGKEPIKNPSPVKANVFGVQSRAKATTIEGAKENEVTGIEWLRHSAALHYVTSLDGISVRQLHNHPPFDQLGFRTMERWCVEDEWVHRRQQYMERIRSDIESHINQRMVETRVEQLKQIDVKVTSLFGEIDKVEPKSKEGMITALVRLMEAGNSLREKLSKEIVPSHIGGTQQDNVPVTPHLTHEDAREAALAILRRRRAAIRGNLQEEKGNGSNG